MSTKTKQSTGGTALLVLAVLFIALVILNQALLRGVRLDLTEGRLYTLSDGTVEVLESLSEPVNLYLFYSDRAARDFAPLQTYASRVEEMLEEFERGHRVLPAGPGSVSGIRPRQAGVLARQSGSAGTRPDQRPADERRFRSGSLPPHGAVGRDHPAA